MYSLRRKIQNEQKLRLILHVFLNYYVQNHKKKDVTFKNKLQEKKISDVFVKACH